MKTRTLTLFAMVALVCLGFALRLYRINVVPLRGDEAFTVIHWMREPLADTLANIAATDPQPPLAYITYRLYALAVGSDENQVRFLPALLNLIGIPALYGLGKRIGGRRLGLLAAFLWSINPYQIWHAQDARNYAVWAALSPAALWLALRALQKRRRVDWLLYVVAAVVTLYFYYLELFVIFVLNVYVLIVYRRDRKLLMQWLASQVVVGLALAPWYLQERLLVGSGYGGTASRFDPSLLFTQFVPSLLLGEDFARHIQALTPILWLGLLAVLVLTLLAGWWVVWKRDRSSGLLLGLLGTVPLLLLAVVSLRLSVFTPRYVLSVSSVYVLLVAVLLLKLWRLRGNGRLQAGFAVTGFGVVLCVGGVSLNNYYFPLDYAKSPDWRSLASYLAQHTADSDLILNTTADEAYTFYHQEYGVTADFVRMPARGDQPVDEIQNLLAEYQPRYTSIWLAAQTDPTWSNAGVVEAWIGAHMQPVRQTSINGLRADQYMNWETDATDQPPLTTFGDLVDLNAAEVLLPPDPDGDLTVLLYWQPLGTSPAPLKVFVHLLITPDAPPLAQDDHFPQQGRVSTANWQPDAVYRDVYTLSVDAVPAGTYTVAVGWYDPETQARVSVEGEEYFALQTITLPDYAN